MSGSGHKETTYATFAGVFDSSTIGRIFNNIVGATNGVLDLHVLFQSTGGNVGDGLALNHLLKTFPLTVHLYNGGSVASIGVIAFLGARRRYASASASFMIHRTRFPTLVPTEAAKLRTLAQNAEADDIRTRRILEAELKIDGSELDVFLATEAPITATRALEIGLIHEIRDFAPPMGERLFSI